LSEGRTRSDWTSDTEHEWRGKLQPVNLVIETDFSADEVRETLRNFDPFRDCESFASDRHWPLTWGVCATDPAGSSSDLGHDQTWDGSDD
jgi:hypothetical protein